MGCQIEIKSCFYCRKCLIWILTNLRIRKPYQLNIHCLFIQEWLFFCDWKLIVPYLCVGRNLFSFFCKLRFFACKFAQNSSSAKFEHSTFLCRSTIIFPTCCVHLVLIFVQRLWQQIAAVYPMKNTVHFTCATQTTHNIWSCDLWVGRFNYKFCARKYFKLASAYKKRISKIAPNICNPKFSSIMIESLNSRHDLKKVLKNNKIKNKYSPPFPFYDKQYPC